MPRTARSTAIVLSQRVEGTIHLLGLHLQLLRYLAGDATSDGGDAPGEKKRRPRGPRRLRRHGGT